MGTQMQNPTTGKRNKHIRNKGPNPGVELTKIFVMLCNPDLQPHPWIGKPELLAEIVSRLMIAWAQDIREEENKKNADPHRRKQSGV